MIIMSLIVGSIWIATVQYFNKSRILNKFLKQNWLICCFDDTTIEYI